MELHQLKYFLAIVDSGTVSRAAVRCGIAQPSLSQQLKKLERTLGIELFQREGRGVVLTDAGRALLPRARKILAEVQDAEANLKRDVESGHGRLAIGAIPTIAPYVLPDAINAVLAAVGYNFARLRAWLRALLRALWLLAFAATARRPIRLQMHAD